MINLQLKQNLNQALQDTSAFVSAMCEAKLRLIVVTNPRSFIQKLPKPEFPAQIANGSIVTDKQQALLLSLIATQQCEENFMNLPTM